MTLLRHDRILALADLYAYPASDSLDLTWPRSCSIAAA